MSRTLFSGHAFMKRYPGYPIVKLRIAPGEAYIALTGHLIHDGTSEGKQYPDVTLHVLGAFGAFLQHKLSLSRPQFSGSFKILIPRPKIFSSASRKPRISAPTPLQIPGDRAIYSSFSLKSKAKFAVRSPERCWNCPSRLAKW